MYYEGYEKEEGMGEEQRLCSDTLSWNDVTAAVSKKAEDTAPCTDRTRGRTCAEVAKELSLQFENLTALIPNVIGKKSLVRLYSVYRDYTAKDDTTLADVGERYEVSRERIRQLCAKAEHRICSDFRALRSRKTEEVTHSVEYVARLLKSIDYDAAALAKYGSVAVGEKRIVAILNMLFGKTFSETVISLPDSNEKRAIAREERHLQNFETYLSKCCFPSDNIADSSKITSLKSGFNYSFEEKLSGELKKFEGHIEIVENPDIIYYYSNTTDHRPQFLLRLPDKRSVLVLTLPTANMAYVYNIHRFNELHKFCKEQGYGYLIIDDRKHSIYDLKTRSLPDDLKSAFDEILESKGMIQWQDVKELKADRSINNADIAAYVLQGKLCFTIDPFFCIKHK